jgi:hypothetical protein
MYFPWPHPKPAELSYSLGTVLYIQMCGGGGRGEGSELFTRLTQNDNSGRLFFQIVPVGDEYIIRASTEIPTTTVAGGSKNQLPGKQPMLYLLNEWFHPV